MPDPGELREHVILQKQVTVDDGGGGTTLNWNPLATIWAAVKPHTGFIVNREQVEGGYLTAQGFYAVTIRYRDDISPETHRFVWNGRQMNIRSVDDPDGHKQWTEIVCEQGVAT